MTVQSNSAAPVTFTRRAHLPLGLWDDLFALVSMLAEAMAEAKAFARAAQRRYPFVD